jgi:hypothetical protein
MEIQCPHCGREGRLPQGVALPPIVVCPHCKVRFRPEPQGVEAGATGDPQQEVQPDIIFCAQCGKANPENNFKCTGCGFVLHGVQPHFVTSADPSLGGLIPYKNVPALWAYYVAIFALIPCLGIPLGVVAIVLGIQGLKHAQLRPTDKGAAHAWTGIILGAICALGYSLLIVVPIVISLSSR